MKSVVPLLTYTVLLLKLKLLNGATFSKSNLQTGISQSNNLDPDNLNFGTDKLIAVVNATDRYLKESILLNPFGKKYESLLNSYSNDECKITNQQRQALQKFVTDTKISFVNDYEISRCCAVACKTYDEKKELAQCLEIFGAKLLVCDEVDHQLYKVKARNNNRHRLQFSVSKKVRKVGGDGSGTTNIPSIAGKKRLSTCLGIISKLRVICVDECSHPTISNSGADCTNDGGGNNCELDIFEKVRLEKLNKIKNIESCEKFKKLN